MGEKLKLPEGPRMWEAPKVGFKGPYVVEVMGSSCVYRTVHYYQMYCHDFSTNPLPSHSSIALPCPPLLTTARQGSDGVYHSGALHAQERPCKQPFQH